MLKFKLLFVGPIPKNPSNLVLNGTFELVLREKSALNLIFL